MIARLLACSIVVLAVTSHADELRLDALRRLHVLRAHGRDELAIYAPPRRALGPYDSAHPEQVWIIERAHDVHAGPDCTSTMLSTETHAHLAAAKELERAAFEEVAWQRAPDGSFVVPRVGTFSIEWEDYEGAYSPRLYGRFEERVVRDTRALSFDVLASCVSELEHTRIVDGTSALALLGTELDGKLLERRSDRWIVTPLLGRDSTFGTPLAFVRDGAGRVTGFLAVIAGDVAMHTWNGMPPLPQPAELALVDLRGVVAWREDASAVRRATDATFAYPRDWVVVRTDGQRVYIAARTAVDCVRLSALSRLTGHLEWTAPALMFGDQLADGVTLATEKDVVSLRRAPYGAIAREWRYDARTGKPR